MPADALVVVGGDIALGPQPVETLQLLDAIGDQARWIRGNCEGPTPHTDKVWEDRRLFMLERIGDETIPSRGSRLGGALSGANGTLNGRP